MQLLELFFWATTRAEAGLLEPAVNQGVQLLTSVRHAGGNGQESEGGSRRHAVDADLPAQLKVAHAVQRVLSLAPPSYFALPVFLRSLADVMYIP